MHLAALERSGISLFYSYSVTWVLKKHCDLWIYTWAYTEYNIVLYVLTDGMKQLIRVAEEWKVKKKTKLGCTCIIHVTLHTFILHSVSMCTQTSWWHTNFLRWHNPSCDLCLSSNFIARGHKQRHVNQSFVASGQLTSEIGWTDK